MTTGPLADWGPLKAALRESLLLRIRSENNNGFNKYMTLALTDKTRAHPVRTPESRILLQWLRTYPTARTLPRRSCVSIQPSHLEDMGLLHKIGVEPFTNGRVP